MFLLNNRSGFSRNDRRQSGKNDCQESKQQSRRQVHRSNNITCRKIFERADSTHGSRYVIYLSMLTRIAISVAMLAALGAVPVYVSARSCVVSDSPVQKACKPGCCANKSCCATSTKRTAPASQPFAKSSAGSELNATFAAAFAAIAPGFVSLDRQSLQRAPLCAIAQPRLAVLCTFLI
jgi:hypothetical protein